jgi:hypothetical protein
VGCGWQRGGYKQKGPGQKGGDRGQSDSSPHAVVADVRVNLEDEHPQPLPASWRALGNTAATSKNAAATREQGFQNVKDAAMLALRRLDSGAEEGEKGGHRAIRIREKRAPSAHGTSRASRG